MRINVIIIDYVKKFTRHLKKSHRESMKKENIVEIIREELGNILQDTRFSCVERRCRHNKLHHHHNVAFECRLDKVIVGVDNKGHWCDMFEEGVPDWSRLKSEN